VWEWLTEPAKSVTLPEQRRRARLLAALVIIIIPLGIVGDLVSLLSTSTSKPFQDPLFILALAGSVILGVAYWLSRTRHHMWGAVIALVTLSAATLASAASAPQSMNTLLVYLLIPIMLGSMLLSARGVIALIAFNIAGILLLPVITPSIESKAIVIPMIYTVFLSVTVVVAAGVRAQDLRQIEQQSRDLAEAVRQAEIANKLKDHFLANMSHELRTPLNAIIGFTEVMLMGLAGELNPQIERAAQRIHFNSERLLKLIDDVLDISKIEAGRVEMLRRPFEPADLLLSIEMSLRPQATKKELKLVTTLDPNLPKHLIGDAKRLEQILVNLATNAVKFTEQGSVTISLQRQSAADWAIVVIDTGIGIPPHAQETIFEKFRQIDGTSRRAYGGTGLGLAIVRELALLMDGSVKVKSSLGSGSAFTVTLPLLVPEGTSNVWKTPS
jgi:signal transduction histidine kinase